MKDTQRLKRVAQRLDAFALRFLKDSYPLFTNKSSSIKQECMRDTREVMTNILGQSPMYNDAAVYQEQYALFYKLKGDVPAQVGDRFLRWCSEEQRKRMLTALLKKADGEEVIPTIVRAIQPEDLENIVLLEKSRDVWKAQLIKDYALSEENTIFNALSQLVEDHFFSGEDTLFKARVLGKADGVMYRLIGDSFTRELLAECKRKFYK